MVIQGSISFQGFPSDSVIGCDFHVEGGIRGGSKRGEEGQFGAIGVSRKRDRFGQLQAVICAALVIIGWVQRPRMRWAV